MSLNGTKTETPYLWRPQCVQNVNISDMLKKGMGLTFVKWDDNNKVLSKWRLIRWQKWGRLDMIYVWGRIIAWPNLVFGVSADHHQTTGHNFFLVVLAVLNHVDPILLIETSSSSFGIQIDSQLSFKWSTTDASWKIQLIGSWFHRWWSSSRAHDSLNEWFNSLSPQRVKSGILYLFLAAKKSGQSKLTPIQKKSQG